MSDPTTAADPGDGPARPGRRVGILGGTFDPPHVGHLVVALDVLDALDLDEVVLMVAGDPWQKRDRPVTPAADRLAMVEAAVAGVPGLAAGTDEVDRDGPTYTVDTLEALRTAEPARELFLVLGTDAAAGLTTWHRWSDLSSLATLVVVDRPGAPAPVSEFPVPVVRVPVAQVELSSSELRRRAAAGRTLRFLVPDAVCAVVAERELYGGRR
ncbi:MAG: nicotinate-nucleotide adenylyltransferase [Actinomycetes bacterium]